MGKLEIQPEAVEAICARLQQMAEEVVAVLAALRSPALLGTEAVGEFGASETYAAMWRAWERQLSMLSEALADLARRICKAAETYRNVDRRVIPGPSAEKPSARSETRGRH